jgi:hypothetical protein
MSQESTPGRKPRVSDTDVLAVFRSASEPVLSTSEVAAALPIKRRATHDRLRALVESGTLARKQIGKSAIYWLPGETATGEASGASEVRA